jgi:hypothetical protein
MQKAHGDTPEKINEYMIQTMRNAGYDYNKIVVDNIDNIPADMVKAVLANSKPPEPTTATKKPAPRKKKSEAR